MSIQKMKDPMNAFLNLRKQIDQSCDHLHHLHQNHTQCKAGCSSCCTNFRVLPIEFHAILNELQVQKPHINAEPENDGCIFLHHDVCTIYESRPIICRSHGLPILEINDYDEPQAELTFCPLNFNKVDDEYFDFENIYDQHEVNRQLYALNEIFIAENGQHHYKNTDLIPLSNLKK